MNAIIISLCCILKILRFFNPNDACAECEISIQDHATEVRSLSLSPYHKITLVICALFYFLVVLLSWLLTELQTFRQIL